MCRITSRIPCPSLNMALLSILLTVALMVMRRNQTPSQSRLRRPVKGITDFWLSARTPSNFVAPTRHPSRQLRFLGTAIYLCLPAYSMRFNNRKSALESQARPSSHLSGKFILCAIRKETCQTVLQTCEGISCMAAVMPVANPCFELTLPKATLWRKTTNLPSLQWALQDDLSGGQRLESLPPRLVATRRPRCRGSSLSCSRCN